MTKRWRVSDIVRAANFKNCFVHADIIATIGESMEGVDNTNRLHNLFNSFDVTIPTACKITHSRWLRMTHRQRCTALVKTAKRLNVPKRG